MERDYSKDPSRINLNVDVRYMKSLPGVPRRLRQVFSDKALDPSEGKIIYSRIPVLGAGIYANLGDYEGATASLMAYGLKAFGLEGYVYTVDRYGEGYPKGYKGYRGSEDKAIRNFLSLGVRDRIIVCKGSTKDWGRVLRQNKFRMIFIDTDHSYEGCKEDFDSWHEMLDEGGEILFHDCHQTGVDRVIKELVESREWRVSGHFYSIKIVKRRES